MGKLIMWNLVTVDGFFEGPVKWSLDWHQYVWGDELERLSIDQLRKASKLLFGRVTYEGMAAYWQTAEGEVADFMNSLPKVVVSRILGKADWNNTTLVNGDVAAAVQRIKQESEGDIYVFGSADLSASLMAHGLFDEYRLAVVPVLLGEGTPLFPKSESRRTLKLLDARTMESGCVILRYAQGDAATTASVG